MAGMGSGRPARLRADLYQRVREAAPDLRGQLRVLNDLSKVEPFSTAEVDEVRGQLFRDHGRSPAGGQAMIGRPPY